jgi:hypothetical protein
MRYCVALISGLILVNSVVAPPARSETAEVYFSGIVPESVTVSAPVVDFKVVDSDNQKGANKLKSVIPLTFNIESNISTNITVSSGRLLSQITDVGFLKSDLTKKKNDINNHNVTLGVGTKDLEVDIPIQQQKSSPAIYSVILTVTP